MSLAIAAPGTDELAPAAEVLARAFRDNPLNRAVIGADAARRLACNRVGMRVQVPLAARHGVVRVARDAGRVVGALLAAPPGAFPFPLPPLRDRLRILVGQGWRVATGWSAVAEQLATERFSSLDWVLSTLGVDPAEQGRGVGRALLATWLEEVDRSGGRVLLETDEERNLRFYARAGFAVEREIRVREVPVWLLERPPRRPSSRPTGTPGDVPRTFR